MYKRQILELIERGITKKYVNMIAVNGDGIMSRYAFCRSCLLYTSRKIAKAISITTTILLSSVFLAFSAFAEGGGIGDAPSCVNTATYKSLVTLVF